MEILNTYPPKEKKKIGRKPKFKIEFMNMVAEKVVVDGMTFREASKTFNISQGSVAVWVKNYKQDHIPVKSRESEVNPSTHRPRFID